MALSNIKEADSTVMFMQGKRQKEIWHLLKIACVSNFLYELFNMTLICCYSLQKGLSA